MAAVYGINQHKSLTKMTQLSRPKRPWFSPFLTESAPQTEFALTHSKQSTEKILTGARTHIKDFQVLPIYSTKYRPVDTTQKVSNSSQKIGRCSLYLSRCPIRASFRFPARSRTTDRRGQRISKRQWNRMFGNERPALEGRREVTARKYKLTKTPA